MSKVFISYARDGSYGENLAVEIQQQLQAAGFAVFRDVIGLKPGDVWYRTLEFELESSDVMVLVVSEKVRTSKWVHNEVSMAEEIGIPVIPVLAEKVRHPLWLRHLQVLDFCGEFDSDKLLSAVRYCLINSVKSPDETSDAELVYETFKKLNRVNQFAVLDYMSHIMQPENSKCDIKTLKVKYLTGEK